MLRPESEVVGLPLDERHVGLRSAVGGHLEGVFHPLLPALEHGYRQLVVVEAGGARGGRVTLHPCVEGEGHRLVNQGFAVASDEGKQNQYVV